MTKKSASKNVIKDIIIVVVGVLAIWFGLQFVFGTENPFYVVSSGSMIPELEVFDVLVVQGNDPFEEVEVGDIIVFNRPAGHDRVIVHRVASIIEEDPLTIRTKGDANPASIPGTDFPITEEEYIGQVVYVIPQVGYVTKVLQPPINYIIIAIIIGVMIYKQVIKKKEEKSVDHRESSENSEDLTFNENDLPPDNAYTSSDVTSESSEKGKTDDVDKKEKTDDVDKKEKTDDVDKKEN